MTIREPSDAEAFVAVLAEEAAAGTGQHPEVEALADYHSGTLSSEAETQVLEHLVGCQHCAQVLLDLESFSAAGARPSDKVVSLAAVAGWRDFETRISAAPRHAVRSRHPRVRALYAMAASLLLGVLGLSFWVASLRQTVAEAYMPQTNPPLYDLLATTRAAEPDEILVEVPSGRPFFLLRVIPGTLEDFSAVEAELQDSGGRVVWSDSDVELTESGVFQLSFSRRSLPAGDYQMRVQGLSADRREILVDRRLRVRYR